MTLAPLDLSKTGRVYELIVIDDSPESSPEKRDRPRQVPRGGGRSRARVVLNEKKDFQAVASRVGDRQSRAGPSKANGQVHIPWKALPVLGVGPAEVTNKKSQEARASTPSPRSSWPCDECRGTADEPLCRLHATIGNKDPAFCNRRVLRCPIKGTLTLVHVDGDSN